MAIEKRGQGKNQFFSRSVFGIKEQYVIIGITKILGLFGSQTVICITGLLL